MKNLFFIIAMLFSLQSCKDDVQPEPEKQYSYWKVNGESFSSNNIDIGIGNARASFQSLEPANRFRLGFCLSYLPVMGLWPLGNTEQNTQQNPNYAYMGVYYNNQFYIHSPFQIDNLFANKVNNKASYYLAPSWFVNYDNYNDSILIEGTFNEP